ncbi:MAG: acyl-CoA dehydrogenase [Clostridiales Family XIII bacterium]|jgi:alkylation response protein AidB-like acyl-CoA dehydrogenase|nr:acyl-CoA dehydrogenase [Clostridiales Family XIII bacterium]
MGNKLMDLRDARFAIYDQLKISDLYAYEKFSDYSDDTVDLAINTAEKLAVNEYYPINAAGDKAGVVFSDGKATVPAEFHAAYQKFCEGGWTAPAESYDYGGQQMPTMLNYLTQMLFFAANQSLMVYTCLTHSAGKVIEIFGTDEQKSKYLEPIWSGRYGGCMDLTEPEAGSDVGSIKTKATPNEDGTFNIKGNKLFISQGESDLTENLIHILLARVEGDPEGTKGLSCFVVPKFRVNDDGTLGKLNDVVCTGVEHKMGMKGSATASLAYGDNNDCIGELIGGRGKGIITMFNMMNEQRIVVGMEGIAMGSSAYLHALDFARERKQGVAFGQRTGPQVPIIEHPDVRRNLLVTKSYTEGIRALLLYAAKCLDLKEVVDDETAKQKYSNLVEILTPICKSGGSDKGFDACVTAIQIFGGYGYCQEYYVEQLARDCKITSIYEGTNGIQANDLLGRKIVMKGASAFQALIDEIQSVIAAAKGIDGLSDYAAELGTYLDKFIETSGLLRERLTENGFLAYSWATPYLSIAEDIAVAWMLLDQSVIASGKLAAGGAAEADAIYYESKINTTKFFISSILPQVTGKLDAIDKNDDTFLKLEDKYFID